MPAIYSEERRSGVPRVGDIRWGTHFCQFYRSEKDLFDILAPYFKAGLEDNEFCLWIVSTPLDAENAKRHLKQAIPSIEEHASRGRIEIIPGDAWQAGGESSDEAVALALDRAMLKGFDGLRLACSAVRKDGKDGKTCTCPGIDVVGRYNIIAAFLYPHDEFDAIALMEVVKNHRFALVPNAGGWEVIESSEAKTVRDALQRTEERLESLFNNMSEGFAHHRMILDDEGKPRDYVFLQVNEAFARLTGLAAKNIVGKRLTEVLPGADRDPADFIGRYGAVALTGEPTRFETYVEALKKWYSVSAWSPHRGFFAVAFTDITERKVMEEAVRRSEEQYRATVESIGDAVITTDGAGIVSFMNSIAEGLTGWTRQEACGQPLERVLDIINEKTRRPVENPMGRVLREGRVLGLANHTTLVSRDGREIPIEDSAAPIKTPDGKIQGAVLVFHDVTERRLSENALRTSEERYRTVFENTSDAILVTDPDRGTVISANPAACRMLGYTGDECLSLTRKDLLDTSDPNFDDLLEEREKKGHASSVLRYRRKNGATFEGELSTAFFNESGGRRHAVSMIRDITERMRADEELRKSRDELEQRVQERTVELKKAYDRLVEETEEKQRVERQLRQAQKLEALGTLAGGIAHDFNNILAAVIGFTEIVKGRIPGDSKVQHQLGRVLEAGIRGRELVQRMLMFARQTEQEKKPLPLGSIVKETAKLLRASIPSTVNIRVRVKSDSAFIFADPVQMQQVVMNLCVNGAYAMREKGGTLDVELSDFSVLPGKAGFHDLEPGSYAKLTIRDTGTGMPPEILAKIFDPFFTTKQAGEGTGLGLSVVDGIVKQHDGCITVESQPGKGSTFSVYLPKAEDHEPVGAFVEETIPTGSERVLFVDDEEALAEIGQTLLERLGYAVTVKQSSREALSAVREAPTAYDLLITDQTMPEMTGVELAREVLSIRADMPIILCTGFSHIVDPEKAREAGVRAFVMKPLTKAEIAKTIRKVLDRKDNP